MPTDPTLNRGISIVIMFFILSMISERFITFVKLYFVEGKRLWLLISKEDDLSLKGDTPEEEKEREMKILKVNISLSIFIAFLANANFFNILKNDSPYSAIGWSDNSFKNFEWTQIHLTIIGCILTGLFISLGSKFWHDMLDMLLQAKNLKQKLGDKATYEVDNAQQLDDWLKVTQSDIVRKVYGDNKEMLKNLKNVIGVGIISDENNNKSIEVVTNDSDTHLIPKTLPYALPNGEAKQVEIKVRISSGIKTHLQLGDDITNKDFQNKFGSCGLAVSYKNDEEKKTMMLTCYHVVIGKTHNYDQFVFNADEDIINPHGDSGIKIGSIRFAIKNNEIDAAIVDLVNNSLNNDKINGIRIIKYEEQYNKVKVSIKGYITKQTGTVTSIQNYASIEYTLPDGITKQQMDLYNLIAVKGDNSKPFSQGGDSGSAVIDDQNKVIGILVAGDNEISYIIPIQTIFNQLNIQLT